MQKPIGHAITYKWLSISSPVFDPNGFLPKTYSCQGGNLNPPLAIHPVPKEAKSLAVILTDDDAKGGDFCHWVLWNLPLTPEIRKRETKGMQGANDFGHHRYDGPCPPFGLHHYTFKVYALDSELNLPGDTGKGALERAMSDHIVGFGEIRVKYEKAKEQPELL